MTAPSQTASQTPAAAPELTQARPRAIFSRRALGLTAGGAAIAVAGLATFARAAQSGGPAAGGAGLEREPVSQLTPVAGSGVGGTVRVRPGAAGRGSVTLTVTGLRPGVIYLAQLYAGPPDSPSASSGRLGELVPGPDGRAALTATEARVGAAGAPVPLTFDLLTDGDHSIAVVAPGVGPVASALLKKR